MDISSDRNESEKEPLFLDAVRKAHIFNVLRMCNGSRAHAAEILGMSEEELQRHIRTLGIVCVNGNTKKRRNRNRLPKGADADE